jgi:hypothetical protein
MEFRLVQNPANNILKNQDFTNFLTRYNQQWDNNDEEPTRFYNDGDRIAEMDNRVDGEDWGYRSD